MPECKKLLQLKCEETYS